MARLPMDERYTRVAMWLHWTIALLVVVNIVVGLGHDAIAPLRAWMPAHKAIGITVLALTALRLAWRLTHRPPPLPPETRGWERGVAHAVHWTLYGLLFAMPLTGWMMVSGSEHRRPLTWFGVFDIPYLPVSNAAGGVGATAHGALGYLMTALVLLHVAAALRHHVLLKDQVLRRMAPALPDPR